MRYGNNFQQRFGSPETKSLIGSLNGTLLGSGANVMPDQGGSGIKSAQRSANFVRAGNSISGNAQKTPQSNNASRNSGGSIKPPRFSHQPTTNVTNLLVDNHAAPTDGNLPSTQYSSSRFPINQNGQMNGFGALSNSSHYNRNNSPGQIIAPSSGGYMGQGLGMVGFLEPTGSEANSTSFYSNNTSVN